MIHNLLPGADNQVWHPDLLINNLSQSIPVHNPIVPIIGEDVNINNVFLELSYTEILHWHKSAENTIRGIWLVRKDNTFTMTLFCQYLNDTTLNVIGPFEISVDVNTNQFESRVGKGKWELLFDTHPEIYLVFIKAINFLGMLSPDLKPTSFRMLEMEEEDGTPYIYLGILHEVCATFFSKSFGFEDLPYLIVRHGNNKPFYGQFDLNNKETFLSYFPMKNDIPFRNRSIDFIKKRMYEFLITNMEIQ